MILTPPLFNPNFGGVPVDQIADVGRLPAMDLKIFGCEIIFEEFQRICTRYLIVTDGQTDRQTDGRLTVASPRSALASRGKNRHGPSLYTMSTTPTCSYRPKLNETVRNVLQNEFEHRLLDSTYKI